MTHEDDIYKRLKKEIRIALQQKLGVKTSKIIFRDAHEDDSVIVQIHVPYSIVPIKQNLSGDIISIVMPIVFENRDETRFPVVFTKFNQKQKIEGYAEIA